jgi:NAD(P)-dependent dehydrogenase (short-subunit alcohol dehydrogenase family)
VIGDVGTSADAERMVCEAIGHMGKVDILVNNAGAPHGLDRNWTWMVPEESFDEVLRVNTKGVFLMSTAVVRHLIEREAPGRIINIASTAGKLGLQQRGAYSASKFAVIGLTQTMAQELKSRDITVNAVCPGAMDTARSPSNTAHQMEVDASILPPGTFDSMGKPSDVARVVTFLADPASNLITGQSIVINGGLLMI